MEEKSGRSAEQVRKLRKNYIFALLFFSLIMFPCASLQAWDCDISLSGPDSVKIGQTVSFSASGMPVGGSYHWYANANLVASGSTAQLTGYLPTYSKYIQVGVTYTTPRGRSCSDSKWVWVCDECFVEVNGPVEACVGESVTLSATGSPEGGAYIWDPLPGLVANGAAAQFTAQDSGTKNLKVTYLPPEASADETCYATHSITVIEEGAVAITGPTIVGVGNSIELCAVGTPAGGTYIWEEHPNLVANADKALFFKENQGVDNIAVSYIAPDSGGLCPAKATHTITSFGVESITVPNCVNSGTTLTKADFTVVTNPPGFEEFVVVSPLAFNTLLQSAEVTVTAASGPGVLADKAETAITVVNSSIKTRESIAFVIPNYLKTPLETIGLAQELTLKISNSYSSFRECCISESSISTAGKTSIGLSVGVGPFTIIGIPIPPPFDNYVVADLLNITLSGAGIVELSGAYKVCEGNTVWSGGGSLTAGVKLGGEVSGKIPEVIILKAEVKGSTNITEKLSIEDLEKLKISTEWGGLKGEVSGEIEVTRFGCVGFKTSKTYFEKNSSLSTTINLPDLK